jgi:hypothetical protein
VERLALLGLVVIGAVTRLPRLQESLWYDEIAAWRDYGTSGIGAVIGSYFDPANHVLHTLLTALSVPATIDLLGTEVALRLPSLLAGLASILVIGGFARRAAGERAGLAAAALVAFLPVMVLEVEARGYGLVMLGTAAATWLLIENASREHPGRWLAYAAVASLTVWAHPVAAFAFAGHGVCLLADAARSAGPPRGRALRGMLALGLAGLLGLALYAPIAPDLLRIRSTFAGSAADTPGLLGPEGRALLLQLGGSWTWWAALPGGGLLVLGILASRRDGELRRAAALSLAGLPLFVLFVIAAGTWVYARFALFALPGAILLMGAGFARLTRTGPRLATALAVAVVAASLADLALLPPRQPLRDAMTYVHRRRAPGERVLAVGLRHEVLEVYAGDAPLRTSLFHGRDLAAELSAFAPRWIILYYPRSVSAETYAVLERAGYAPEQRYRGWADWNNGDVEVWGR